MTLDEIGMAFAQACHEQGFAGFSLRTTDEGDVRMVGLSLPPSLVAYMLRAAADAYEEQVTEGRVN